MCADHDCLFGLSLLVEGNGHILVSEVFPVPVFGLRITEARHLRDNPLPRLKKARLVRRQFIVVDPLRKIVIQVPDVLVRLYAVLLVVRLNRYGKAS